MARGLRGIFKRNSENIISKTWWTRNIIITSMAYGAAPQLIATAAKASV